MSQTPLTPFVTNFAGQLISHTPELMRDLYIPAAQEHGAQWLDQRFGAVRYHDPLTEQSLMNLVDRLCLLAASMCEEILASRNQQIDQLDRDARNLQERLKDALEALEALEALDRPAGAMTVEEAKALAAAVPSLDAKTESLLIQALEKAQENASSATGERNGIKRPKNGATRTVWDVADSLREEINQNPTRQQVVERSSSFGINSGTSASCYSKWCQFNGINPKNPLLPFEPKEKEMKDTLAPVAAPPPPIPAYLPPPPIPAYLPPAPLPPQ